ncbi:MAG: site-specific DNA-methyltransferase [Acidobacteria bacterium]|nr:site-specific DNA-methyltransferase [Acidobacteriota bacterium]
MDRHPSKAHCIVFLGLTGTKGPKVGQYSCHPLGKNPGDVWVIPNVKHNHPEKTIHPCQFPIELVERLVLALTNPGDLVVDPYLGVGSTACAAAIHGRKSAGAEVSYEYLKIARERLLLAFARKLPRRPLGRPIYVPGPNDRIAKRPPELAGGPPNPSQLVFSQSPPG